MIGPSNAKTSSQITGGTDAKAITSHITLPYGNLLYIDQGSESESQSSWMFLFNFYDGLATVSDKRMNRVHSMPTFLKQRTAKAPEYLIIP